MMTPLMAMMKMMTMTGGDDDDDDDDDNDDDEEIGKVFPFSFSNLDALPGIHTQRSGSAGICEKNTM